MKIRNIYRYAAFTVLMASLLMQGCSFLPDPVAGTRLGTLTLHQFINVPPGKTRVFMQDGKIVDTFDHYMHNCNIEVRRRDDVNQQAIIPATFDIVYLQETTERVVGINSDKPLMLAFGNGSGNQSHLGLSLFGSSPSNIYRGFHFGLAGEDKNVFRLSCRGEYAEPYSARLPGVSGMRVALGEIMTINLENINL